MLNPFRSAMLAAPDSPNPQPQIEAWTTSQLESVVWSDVLGVPLDDMPRYPVGGDGGSGRRPRPAPDRRDHRENAAWKR
jgi:hypothetical protein